MTLACVCIGVASTAGLGAAWAELTTPSATASDTATATPSDSVTPTPTDTVTPTPTPTDTVTPTPTPTPTPSDTSSPTTPGDQIPDQLVITSLSQGTTSVTLAFTGPANGANVQYLRVTVNGVTRVASGTSSPIVISGLSPNADYTFTIRAGNPAGEGPDSAPMSTRTRPVLTLPAAPGLAAVTTTGTAIAIRVSGPAYDGGTPVTRYELAAGTGPTIAGTQAFEHTFAGLTPMTSYTFTARVANALGWSNIASITVKTPAMAPSTVRNLAATAPRGVATISWDPPASENGAPVTGYTVDAAGVGQCTATAPATRCTISGLRPNVPTAITVTAVNAAGTSVPVSTGVVFNASVPAPPAAVTVTHRETVWRSYTTVRISPSPNDGGLDISSYRATIAFPTVSYKSGITRKPATKTCTFDAAQIARNELSCEFERDASTPVKPNAVTAVATNALGDSARADAFNAFILPPALRNVRATAGDKQITITWDPPAAAGINSATKVQVTVGGGLFFCNVDPAAGSCTLKKDVDAYVNGRTYAYDVAARNGFGVGPATRVEATPFGPPEAPVGVAAKAGNGSVTVSWYAPWGSGGRPVTNYRVRAVGSTANACTQQAAGGFVLHSCTVAAVNGREVAFTVAAANAAGWGPTATSPKATPLAAPVAPVIVDFTQVGERRARVSWTFTAAANTSAATTFEVENPAGERVCTGFTGNARFCESWGLAAGTEQRVRVRAVSDMGAGAWSAWSQPLRIQGRPDAPGAPTARVGLASATVSWTAPTSGGAPQRYMVTSDPPGRQCEALAPSTTCEVKWLTPNTAYAFTVHAVNVAGEGPQSGRSPVVVTGLPLAPVNVRAEAAGRGIRVHWLPGTAAVTPTVERFTAGMTGVAACEASGDATSCLIEQPPIGRELTIRVTARNGAGAATSVGTATLTLRTPGAPRSAGFSSELAGATLTWAPPADAGSLAVAGYVVRRADGSEACRTDADTRSCLLPAGQLSAAVSQRFAITARSAVGEGAAAAVDLLYGAPAAPANVRVQQLGTDVTVAWDAAHAPLTRVAGYTARASTGQQCSTSALTLQCTLKGLPPATRITLAVRATNPGAASADLEVNVVGAPGVPREVRAVAGDQRVVVLWDRPAADELHPVDGYEVWASNSIFISLGQRKVCDLPNAAITECIHSGLENGESWIYWVYARNRFGQSDISVLSNLASPTAEPERVTRPPSQVATSSIAVAIRGEHVALAWQPVSDTGGARLVTYYAVLWEGRSWPMIIGSCTTYATSCSIPISTIRATMGEYWYSRINKGFVQASVVAWNSASGSTDAKFKYLPDLVWPGATPAR